MRHLLLVNIVTGRIDEDVPFDCDAGMVMTPIYANITRASKAGQVTVEYQGGKMGHDEDVDIEPSAAK
jgi:hypothetical protein